MCVQRPLNCADIDLSNGLCLKCIEGDYQLQNGQCVFVRKCKDN